MVRRLFLAVACAVAGLILVPGCGQPGTGDGKPGTESVGGKPSLAGIEKYLEGLPKDSLPRSGKDGDLERVKANKWLKQNGPGKDLEIAVELAEVKIGPGKDDKYTATLVLAQQPDLVVRFVQCAGRVRCAGTDWVTLVHLPDLVGLDEPTAKALRDLGGKVVRLRGNMTYEQGQGFVYDLYPQFVDEERRPYFFFGFEPTGVEVAPGKDWLPVQAWNSRGSHKD